MAAFAFVFSQWVHAAAVPERDVFPPPVHGGRLLPVVKATTKGLHTFLQMNKDGTPTTWSPCSAIHYVIDPAEMPADGVEAVNEAIQQVSLATGLKFVPDGFSRRRPSNTNRPRIAHGTYQPVLIAWATGEQFSPVAGYAGVTLPAPVRTSERGVDRYVSGQVVLEAEEFADLAASGHEDRERAIIMHELGHLVGLDHVNDRNEIMNPTNTAWAYGPGDLQGLAEAGSGRCNF